MVAQLLADVAEVRPGIIKGMINPAIGSAPGAIEGNGPIALQGTAAQQQGVILLVVGTCFHAGQRRALVIESPGKHVDGSAYGGHRNLGS